MTEQVMATEEFVGDFLEHYGVPGMRWGHRKEQRTAALTERKKTREAVRKVNAKGVAKDDASILKARAAASAAQRRVDRAKDQHKIDRSTATTRAEKIAAKRALKVSVAELRRINNQADKLTEDEQFAYDMMQLGRGVADALFAGNPRSTSQKMWDAQNDRARVRAR